MRYRQLVERLDKSFMADWRKIRSQFKVNVSFRSPLKEFGDGVELALITSDNRGQGHATRAMQAILDLADKHNTIITLNPSASGGGNEGRLTQDQLETWYKRLGFVDSDVEYYMIRYPK